MGKPLPIILSIPHGGLEVPPEVSDRLAVDAITLHNECDLWADQLYDFNEQSLTTITPSGYTPRVLATVSMRIARALIDVNRAPDDLANSDGPVKTQTSYGEPLYTSRLDDATKRSLRERYWQPFHDQLAATLAEFDAQARLLLDCHNMAQRGPTAYPHAGAARPLICLSNFGDDQGEPTPSLGWTTCPPALLRQAGQLAAELFADLPLLEPAGATPPVVALNWPFPGGMIIRTYSRTAAGTARLPAIMVEVNRGLFVGNQDARTPIQPADTARIGEIRQRLYQWAIGVIDLIG